jgi:NTE family protein
VSQLPRVGLALSGGVAKVVAHVGILRALEESRVPIDAIAATSGGSIIGAFYAAGTPIEAMEELAREISWKRLTRVTLPRLGLLSNERIQTFMEERLGPKRFEDLRIPLAIVAADLTTGRKAVFTEGPLPLAIRASCSIPQLFSPVEIDGHLIADGGLVEYLPVETLRDELAIPFRIGVNLGGVRNWHMKDPRNLLEVALRVIGFVSQRNARASEQAAQFVVRPNLSDFGPYDLHRSDELMRAGYEYGRRAAPEILARLEQVRGPGPEPEPADWSRVVRWLRNHSPLGRRAT